MTGRTPQDLVLHWNKLKGERAQFERTWQEIADYIRPLRSEFTAVRSPGDKRHTRIFDAAPLMAADSFAGGIYGMMTNPANRWFALRLQDDELNDFDPVRDWLYEVESRILHSFGPQVSRFYSVLPSLYADLACFGTGVFYLVSATVAALWWASDLTRRVKTIEQSTVTAERIARLETEVSVLADNTKELKGSIGELVLELRRKR